MTTQEIIAIVLGGLGLLFMIISTIGIIKLPDFFTRLHAQGIGDTLGAMLILASMMVLVGLRLITWKIAIIFLVIMLTNPMATNLIICAAMRKKNYQGINEKEVDEK